MWFQVGESHKVSHDSRRHGCLIVQEAYAIPISMLPFLLSSLSKVSSLIDICSLGSLKSTWQQHITLVTSHFLLPPLLRSERRWPTIPHPSKLLPLPWILWVYPLCKKTTLPRSGSQKLIQTVLSPSRYGYSSAYAEFWLFLTLPSFDSVFPFILQVTPRERPSKRWESTILSTLPSQFPVKDDQI